MPNKNYRTGRSYEYRAKQELEADGWTVIRASGSHGPWDLIACRRPNESVRCIQVKYTTSPHELRRLQASFYPTVCSGPPTWHSELWVWHAGSCHILPLP